MHGWFKSLICVLCSLCLTGCTVLGAVGAGITPVTPASKMAMRYHPGDSVRIYPQTGGAYIMTVTSLDEQAIFGTVGHENTPTRVPWHQIHGISGTEDLKDSLKSTLIIAGVVVGTLYLLLYLTAVPSMP